MTAATLEAPVDTTAPVARVGIARLTLVELRKLTDTRAGLWLLIVIGLAMAGASAVLMGWGDDADMTWETFYEFSLVPSAVLLPVLGILSMTGEWTQRTALSTFTLVPVRGRVIVAKLSAAVLVGAASWVVALAFSALANTIGSASGGNGDWHLDASLIWQGLLQQVVFALMGSAFGAMLLNSAVAIVVYFVLPTLWTVLGGMIKWLHRAASWLDINITGDALTHAHATAGQLGRFGVSAALWVLLPLAVGTARVLRKEVS